MYYVISKTAPVTLFASVAKRDEARDTARTLGGTVKTEAEYKKIGYTPPAPKAPTMMDIAKKIAKTTKRTTVGKAAPKVAKRVEATPAALAAGAKALAAAQKAELNKVGIVRSVSKVSGLARRDVIALITAADLGIALATISTQFQVVRSGKLNK